MDGPGNVEDTLSQSCLRCVGARYAAMDAKLDAAPGATRHAGEHCEGASCDQTQGL